MHTSVRRQSHGSGPLPFYVVQKNVSKNKKWTEFYWIFSFFFKLSTKYSVFCQKRGVFSKKTPQLLETYYIVLEKYSSKLFLSNLAFAKCREWQTGLNRPQDAMFWTKIRLWARFFFAKEGTHVVDLEVRLRFSCTAANRARYSS